jgi:hypothetical protein
MPTIDRSRPGKGFRHLPKQRDVEAFIELLPDWHELSVGLNAIVLASGSDNDCMGWHEPGVVHVCAWEEDLWWEAAHPWFVHEHRDIRSGRQDHPRAADAAEPTFRSVQPVRNWRRLGARLVGRLRLEEALDAENLPRPLRGTGTRASPEERLRRSASFYPVSGRRGLTSPGRCDSRSSASGSSTTTYARAGLEGSESHVPGSLNNASTASRARSLWPSSMIVITPAARRSPMAMRVSSGVDAGTRPDHPEKRT